MKRRVEALAERCRGMEALSGGPRSLMVLEKLTRAVSGEDGLLVEEFALSGQQLRIQGAAASYDRAYLYDTAGNDTFWGTVDDGRMVTSGGGENKAIGFDNLRAYALNGGTDDRAYLTGSGGMDYLFAREAYSTFSGSGFYHYLQGFDYLEADVGSAPGGGGAV